MFKQLLYSVAIVAVFSTSSFAGTIYNFASFRPDQPGWNNANLQFSVEVSDSGFISVDGNTLISFLFRNNTDPLYGSTIKEIYFDDGTLLQIPGETFFGSDPDYVEFVEMEPNKNGLPRLPGGENIDWDESVGFAAVLDTTNQSGFQGKGIDAGESLEVIIELQMGLGFADTIAALELALTNPSTDIEGGLRIGLHVGSFGNDDGSGGGFSDSFVNGPPDDGPGGGGFVPVPEPSSVLIWGLLGLTGLSPRRKRS